jgi:hypothetical protein
VSWREGSRSPSFVKLSLYRFLVMGVEYELGESIREISREEKGERLCCSLSL